MTQDLHNPSQAPISLDFIQETLSDLKAKNITVIDIGDLADFADHMIIAEGTSKRHIKSIADNLAVEAKKIGHQPLGREGEQDSDWVLVDLGSVIVHIMMPQAREFYDLEGLWQSAESLEAFNIKPHS